MFPGMACFADDGKKSNNSEVDSEQAEALNDGNKNEENGDINRHGQIIGDVFH